MSDLILQPMQTTLAGAFDIADLRSVKNLRFACHLSDLAYGDKDHIRAELSKFGVDGSELHFLEGQNLFGFMVQFPNFAFIAFRGTQTKGDWFDNLDIRMIRTFCGEIHRGFANCFDSIPIEQIQKIAASFKSPAKIFLTGHSKGGALAVIASAVLARNGLCPEALYTFGQPKVGGRRFAQWFDTYGPRVYMRVTNGADIVPHLPPSVEDIPFLLLAALSVLLLLPVWLTRKATKQVRERLVRGQERQCKHH